MPRIRTYGLDIDTIRFAQRVKSGSGTTILPEPLKQINRFVVGVKKLGLWNSMVCWPSSSIHNAGTGSVLYSLGRGDAVNGTLQNAPSWSYQGLLFNGINQRVTLPNNVFGTSNNPTTVFTVFRVDSSALANNQWSFSTGGNTDPNTFGMRVIGSAFRPQVTYSSTSLGASNTNWNYFLVGNSTTNGFGSINGSSLTQFNFSTGVTLNKVGDACSLGSVSNPLTQFLSGQIAFTAVFYTLPTQDLNSLIYNLYKKTFGLTMRFNLP